MKPFQEIAHKEQSVILLKKNGQKRASHSDPVPAKMTFWFEIPLSKAEPANADSHHKFTMTSIYESQICDLHL